MSYARRTDRTHQTWLRYFRAQGLTVTDTSRLPGFVDLVCAWQPDCPRIALVEVKVPKGRLTKAQGALHRETYAWVVRDEQDAARVIQWLKTGLLATMPQSRLSGLKANP